MKLQLNDVVKSYGADVVLDRVNIQIKDNEKIALVGRNGCGKTTLLKIICEKSLWIQAQGLLPMEQRLVIFLKLPS